MPKMTLLEASKLLGLSVNGLRSRAKKDPARYGLSVDNGGRLWLDFDPGTLVRSKPSRILREGYSSKAVKPMIEGNAAVLQARLEAAERARDVAEADRDHWRSMAEALAAKRWRFWPF
jgi:hypothetical protein